MEIQKFGIEIRSMGNVKNVYKDVDRMLGNYNIPKKGINVAIQIQTVAHSLQKMMSVENYFDVCAIRNCAKLCQINISNERMSMYSSIHCMGWNEMTPEYKQAVVAMVLDDFREVLNYEEELK